MKLKQSCSIALVVAGLFLGTHFAHAAGSLILKVLAVNPSAAQEQEVPLKTYLPVEARPENVLNKDEDSLDIKFDPQQSLYYVEKKVTLKPGESYTLKVHIEDIWMVPEDQLGKIQKRADLAFDSLKGAVSFDMAKLLHDNISQSLILVRSRQSDETQLPHEHIATYRANQQLLQDVNKDLNSLELFAAKNSGSDKTKNPFFTAAYTWKLMLGIIAFLAVLSFSSFMVWQKQLKDMVKTSEINMVAPEERVQFQKKLMEHAITDNLTGLFNVGHFRKIIDQEMESAKTSKKPFSLIMVDVDHFKKINDSYGHAAGDEVLKNVAQILQSKIKKFDTAFRYGGEEFVILIAADQANTMKVADRLRKALESQSMRLGPSKVPYQVTASFGVAAFNYSETQQDLVNRADQALYRAKRGGRNQVIGADEAPGA